MLVDREVGCEGSFEHSIIAMAGMVYCMQQIDDRRVSHACYSEHRSSHLIFSSMRVRRQTRGDTTQEDSRRAAYEAEAASVVDLGRQVAREDLGGLASGPR